MLASPVKTGCTLRMNRTPTATSCPNANFPTDGGRQRWLSGRLREAGLVALSLLALLLVAPAAKAQVPLFVDEVERVDVIAIERDGRELYAFDALTGRRSTIRLAVGEDVSFIQARGRVGVVVTDQRVLGVGAGTSWIEERFRLQEVAPVTALVEDRIGMVATSRRVLAFAGTAGWVEETLSPNEQPTALRVGSGVAVVMTNRRALGISPTLGRFVPEALRIHEELESLTTQDTLVSARTDRRILVFSAPRARWTEQKRRIN